MYVNKLPDDPTIEHLEHTFPGLKISFSEIKNRNRGALVITNAVVIFYVMFACVYSKGGVMDVFLRRVFYNLCIVENDKMLISYFGKHDKMKWLMMASHDTYTTYQS